MEARMIYARRPLLAESNILEAVTAQVSTSTHFEHPLLGGCFNPACVNVFPFDVSKTLRSLLFENSFIRLWVSDSWLIIDLFYLLIHKWKVDHFDYIKWIYWTIRVLRIVKYSEQFKSRFVRIGKILIMYVTNSKHKHISRRLSLNFELDSH